MTDRVLAAVSLGVSIIRTLKRLDQILSAASSTFVDSGRLLGPSFEWRGENFTSKRANLNSGPVCGQGPQSENPIFEFERNLQLLKHPALPHDNSTESKTRKLLRIADGRISTSDELLQRGRIFINMDFDECH